MQVDMSDTVRPVIFHTVPSRLDTETIRQRIKAEYAKPNPDDKWLKAAYKELEKRGA